MLDERLLEHAEGVDLPDGKMDGERRRRDQPAGVTGPCDRALTVEHRQHDEHLPALVSCKRVQPYPAAWTNSRFPARGRPATFAK